jgi:hypothetical protein
MALVLIWENLDWWRRARTGLAVAVEFASSSVALADPHRYVGGFQGLVYDTG